ncbi:hypothetical protein [Thiohalocapsa sp. ML1]|jgi:hypothetical protein|uniref:hypothetical protein n=1 Tax=Thiohalocapsa sp. ML1 TaxID=1431688 RepID=UPI0012E3B0E2|nr:hypothetical protein [Thiohalocapsa sp. ML1]
MSVRLRMIPIALLAAAAGLDAPAALATVATGDGASVVRPAPGVVDATAHKHRATNPDVVVDPTSARYGRAGALTAKATLNASDVPPGLGVTTAAPTPRGRDDDGVVIGAGLRHIGMSRNAESAGEHARALPEHSPTSASGPTTVALLGIGLAVLGLRQRRARARARRAGAGRRPGVMRVRRLRRGRICAADRAGAAS